MKIQFKGLNPNETYCCTKKDIKAIFGNEDIKVIFGLYNLSRDEAMNSKKYRPSKNCNDIIIARMVTHRTIVNVFGYEERSYLSFFILNKNDYSVELYSKFILEVLPKLKKLFEEHKNEDYIANHGAFEVTIGLNDNQFNFYESRAKKMAK